MEIEKRVYKSSFEDGLIDIMIGSIFIALGISPYLGEISGLETFGYLIFYLLLILPGFIFQTLGKLYIVQPRIGSFKPGPKQKLNLKLLFLMNLIQLTITIILLLFQITGSGSGPTLPGYSAALLFSFFIFLPFSVLAFSLKVNRLYLIGFMGAMAMFLTETVASLTGRVQSIEILTFGTVGIIIMSWGIVFFIRFLKKYPKIREVEVNGEEEV